MKSFLKKQITPKQIIIAFLLIFLFISGVVITSLTINEINERINTTESSTQTAIQPTKNHVDPGLDEYITELNIDSSGLNFIYVDSLPETGANGDFISPNTIRIKRVLPAGESPRTILAHEYMHYVWTKHTQQERDVLSAELESIYSNDVPMQHRMKGYISDHNLTEGSEGFSNELHSIYCTESSDAFLTTPILDECNKWIYRPALTFVR